MRKGSIFNKRRNRKFLIIWFNFVRLKFVNDLAFPQCHHHQFYELLPVLQAMQWHFVPDFHYMICITMQSDHADDQ